MEQTEGTVSHIESPVNTTTNHVLNENQVQGLTRKSDPDPDDQNGAGSNGEGLGESGLTSTELTVVKRKRGRPRKYDVVDGAAMGHVSSPPPVSGGGSLKRGRGRPKGSGKLQLLASLGGLAVDTAGGSFTPHVITVETGEDVFTKILSFSQRGPRAICILSATGVVSTVHICHSSGVLLSYEGRFEILSLSGSFVFGELSGSNRKNGMLSVSLAKPDGRVIGGSVAGSLLAAGPIQLIVGSFKQDIGKQLKSRLFAERSTAANVVIGSDLVRVPVLMAPNKNGDESFVTPTSALLESARGGVGSVLQASQAILADHRLPTDNNTNFPRI